MHEGLLDLALDTGTMCILPMPGLVSGQQTEAVIATISSWIDEPSVSESARE